MIEFFTQLSKEEVKKFRKFVNSPYHNSYYTIVKLFEYLNSKYPDIKKEDLMYKPISDYVYGLKKGNKLKFRKLLSDFTQVFEMFLIQIENERDTVRNKIVLLSALRERKMKKRFAVNYKIIETEHSKVSDKVENFYLNDINLHQESKNMYTANDMNLRSLNIQNISNSIDSHFLISKIYIFLDMNTLETDQLNTFDFKKGFYYEVQDYIEKNMKYFELNNVLIVLLFYAIKIFTKKDERFLFELTKYYDTYNKHFTKEHLFEYYCILENSYQILPKNPKNYIENANKMYEVFYILYGIKNYFKEIHEKNGINMTEFTRVVRISLVLDKYDWVLSFIENYNTYLQEQYKNEVYNITKAQYFFSVGNYDESLNCVNNIKFKDQQYYYLSKVILLKIYFELGDDKSLKYLINNLNKFFRENSPVFHLRKLKIFLKYLSHLIKFKFNPGKNDKDDANILKKELEKTVVDSGYKKWLLEKLEDFR